MSTPQLSKPKTDPPRKPTRAELEEYCEVSERRKELEREAAQLKRREDVLKGTLMAYASHAGGPTRTVTSCGHRYEVFSVRGQPPWQREFEQRHPDEVDEVRAGAPMQDRLRVSKV